MRHYKYKLLKEKIEAGEKPKVYVVSKIEQDGYEYYSVSQDYCNHVALEEGEIYAYCDFNFEVNITALHLHRDKATEDVVQCINKSLEDGNG